MKTWNGIVAAVVLQAIAGCATAPTITVTCSTSPSLTVNSLVAGTLFLGTVVQSVTYTDTGTPNVIGLPLNNENVVVVSSLPGVAGICAGFCAVSDPPTAAQLDEFGSEVTVETDKNGLLIYTVLVTVGEGDVTGQLVEAASGQAPTSCAVPLTVSGPGT